MRQVCVRCSKEKTAVAFNRNKVRPDGLCSYCKVCNAAAAAERRKTRKPVLQPTVTHKVLLIAGTCYCYVSTMSDQLGKPVLQPTVAHKVRISTSCIPREHVQLSYIKPWLCRHCKVCNADANAERRKTRKPVLQPTVTHKVLPIIGFSASQFQREHVQLM